MKIAFICQPWNSISLPVKSGSIVLWTYEVARRLGRSCEVIVYAKRGRHQKKSEEYEGVYYRRMSNSADRWLLRFLKIAAVFFKRKNPLFSSTLYHLVYVLKIAKDLRSQQCDIVHIHNFSQYVPIIRYYNPSIKIALHMHCEWLNQLKKAMIIKRLEGVDLVIGCSEYITRKIQYTFPSLKERCISVYNGVDTKHFFYKNNYNTQKRDSKKRLLFVGRITPEKGLHVLLDAFREVVRRHPEAQLDIVGPESRTPPQFIIGLTDDSKVSELAAFYSKSYLAQLRDRLSAILANHVTFLGFVPHTDLINHYQSADVFVNPSFSDAFPLTIPEAMATGLPVVATRVGGMPEAVIHNKTGILVEPGDAHALAESIVRLLADSDLRETMGKAARQRAVKFFSWEQIAEDLLARYKGMCKSDG